MSLLIPLFKRFTGLREQDIRTIILNAPNRYKTYTIPKRTSGNRLISQPAKELKILQRIVASEILDKLSVHDAAMAYKKNKSIKDNASAHVVNGPILKLDFREFFPSLKSTDWRSYCEKNMVFTDAEDLAISINVLFYRKKGSSDLRLAIGAPSSPQLSNILMYEFDENISSRLKDTKVVYTRYADDLVFSAPRTGYLQGLEKTVKKVLKETKSPSLRINEEKTVYATKKYKRMVTGLILSNDNVISIGHKRKRWLRVAMHHASIGRLDSRQLSQLSGWLAFVKDVEPSFFRSLCAKHDRDLLIKIKASPRDLQIQNLTLRDFS